MAGGQTLYSALWHRVEGLRPELKPGVTVERHIVRDEVWYVTRDRLSNASHRLSAPVYALLMRMDGKRTIDQIWTEMVRLYGADAPSQDRVIQTLGQLGNFDLLRADVATDERELASRAETLQGRRRLQQVQNPLFFKLRLLDPNAALGATRHLVRPLFTGFGFLLWLACMVWLGLQAFTHWPELSNNFSDRLLAPSNLVILLALYPAIKLVHELGHAYATRVFGGEVHEIGLMFLVFMPAPYVDASASAAFPDKWRRSIVAAAGMMAELLLAALAMLVWIEVEPGPLRSICFNVMTIAGVSTLVFNGNPLLRFDAYYILADLAEIPNLAGRAGKWWLWLAQRHLFGLRGVTSPVTGRGEALWFALYAPASLAYRLTVVASIALVVGTQYFFIGVLLVVWTLTQSFLWPAFNALRHVLVSPALAERRLRAVTATFGGIALVVGLVGWLPLPHGTIAEGVTWMPEQARVVADTQGTVVGYLVTDGQEVEAEAAVARLEDPFLVNEERIARARLAELRQRFVAAETNALVGIEVVRRQIEFAERDLADAERRLAALVVRAPRAGRAVLPRARDMIGSHVTKGTVLAYVIPPERAVVRVAVPETEIDRVRTATLAAEVRFAEAPRRDGVPAELVRMVPGAGRRLPSLALARDAGGPFVLDPTAKEKDTALLPFFEVDLMLPADFVSTAWGERVWVRFDHGRVSLFDQFHRAVRQVLLKRFNV